MTIDTVTPSNKTEKLAEHHVLKGNNTKIVLPENATIHVSYTEFFNERVSEESWELDMSTLEPDQVEIVQVKMQNLLSIKNDFGHSRSQAYLLYVNGQLAYATPQVMTKDETGHEIINMMKSYNAASKPVKLKPYVLPVVQSAIVQEFTHEPHTN